MKKSLKRTFGYAVGVFAVALFAFSCANPLSPTLPIDSTGAKTLVNGVETFTLWAGQHIDAGRVSVWRDASKLYVKYETNSSFTIDQTHVWVGSSLSDLPVNNLGVPAPGQFPSVIGSYAAGTKTATISFSFLPSWEGKSLYIFSHAALLSTQYGNQTGWAGDNSLNISRWNFYMNVVPPTIVPVDPEDPEEPEIPLTYTISGFVFHDLDSDGVKDDGEPGLSGVQVSLAGGASVISGSDGAYSFAGLAAGNYTVNSGNLAGFFPTPYDLPTVSRTVSLPESKTGVNFGLSYESISGRAFRDSNANGAFDSGEEGLAGVRLALSGAATGSVMSGPDGSYLFDHLKGGSSLYTVAAGDVAGEYHTPYAAPFVSWTGSVSASGVDFGYSHESVSGVVFYDANRNDVYDAGEPLLSGFGVRLNTGASAVSGSDGSYLFDNLIGGSSYTVSANDKEGFVHSVAVSRTVFPANAVPAKADFGFAVDYSWIPGKLANGFTIGYWKNNVDKAIAGKTSGIQVSKSVLLGYLGTLSNFALDPLNHSADSTGLKAASAVLSATGSSPTLLLAKQLQGSEFNYASGAYIGGNALVTAFFLYDGEYMLQNPLSFSSFQLLAQKDRYDAYNNSHGGAVLF